MRILVISDKSIFGEGLCALLAQSGDLEVIGQVAEACKGRVAARIEQLRPDVLVIDCPDEESDPAPDLMRCLKNGWVRKIVMVNRKNNTMYVFTGERRDADDLLMSIAGTASRTPAVAGGGEDAPAPGGR